MRWPSPWGLGFPGWHIECSTMSCKYLGDTFDIHGGGMDLIFPHHEAEIAQCVAANKQHAARYWIHNNMITIDGQKMGKSLGNFITLSEFFDGSHKKLAKSYHPMVIKFFILQAHYRSTVDFSNQALQASEKGLIRLFSGLKTLDKIKPGKTSSVDITQFKIKCYEAMSDDLNTPIVLSYLFDLVKIINSTYENKYILSEVDLVEVRLILETYIVEIFGLVPPEKESESSIDAIIKLLLETIIYDLRLYFHYNNNSHQYQSFDL